MTKGVRSVFADFCFSGERLRDVELSEPSLCSKVRL